MRGLLAAIGICAVLAAGCAGGRPIEQTSDSPDAPDRLPQIPAPSALLKSSAATVAERYAVGAQADLALPQNHFALDGPAGVFSPAAGGVSATLDDAAYAGYRFALPDYDGPPVLRLRWDPAPDANDVWLGLADFAEDRWQWFSPGQADLLELAALEPYLAPDGTLLVIVLVLGAEVRLDCIGVGAAPTTWLVDNDAPPGGDGLSWDTAFCDLQEALEIAQPEDEIWVAAGYYVPGTNQYDSFAIGDFVAVYGGFAGTETQREQRDWEAHPTILSGNSSLPLDEEDNSFHVVVTGGGAVLDGFTVCDGIASGQWQDTDRGGGIYAAEAPLTVANCRFEDNYASVGGGGICFEYGWSTVESRVSNCSFSGNSARVANSGGGAIACFSVGSLKIDDCDFSGNTAGGGGAIYLFSSFGVDISGCTFSSNEAVDGGALYWRMGSGTLSGCEFTGNYAGWYGGAFCSRDAYVDIRDCRFVANQSEFDRGGAVHTNLLCRFAGCDFLRNTAMAGGAAASWQSDTVFNGCRFAGNTAAGEGGAVYAFDSAWPVFIDCLFAGNTAAAGGAIFSVNESDFELLNSTLTANTAGHGGALASSNSRPWIANSILFGNVGLIDTPEVYTLGSYLPSYHCCDIAGCGGSGAGWDYDLGHDLDGNIEGDPLFGSAPAPGPDGVWGTADDDYGSLVLSASSPCIDAGDNNELDGWGSGLDFAGAVRFVDDPLTADTGYGTPPLIDIGAYEYQGP